ncbi:hypothetical protein HMPREF1141_0661 [Clostridium sp. MSTE9]|nr:hypothetical protein HMPREF1141_0661 [Clostridium sp. MSTE9]
MDYIKIIIKNPSYFTYNIIIFYEDSSWFDRWKSPKSWD